MSEHLEPLVAAYVAQRQRDFHQRTRGIPTPESRAVWEFDASEKIRAHDQKVKAEAWDEGYEWVDSYLAGEDKPRTIWDNPYRAIESQGTP